jgi:AcrR family transcriptional regulator
VTGDHDGRVRLLDAAEARFGARSYHTTTVADLCEHADMATGSFYRYFDTKRDVFVAVVRRINDDLRAAMRRAVEQVGGDQREVERAAFGAFFDLMSKRPHAYRIVREAEFVAPGVFREYYERLARGYARGVRHAQLRGDVDPDLDPELVAYVYMGIGYFVGMRWIEWTAGDHVPGDLQVQLLVMLRGALETREDPP